MAQPKEPKVDVVHKYFHGGPVSIDLIEKSLYLGSLSAAMDVPTLNKHRITHILTIDTVPLPRNITDIRYITSKFIKLSDQPKEDLLKHFYETAAFIDNGIAGGGNVLVHCYFGVSRSATVVIAYVMKKYGLSYGEAFKKVKKRRSIVYPNPGFVVQLKLYEEMGYTVNPRNVHYKNYRLTCAADKVKKAKILPNDFHDLVKTDPGLTQIQPEPNVYRCKKCRRVLASESNLITHEDKASKTVCSKTYFLEPLSWMNGVSHAVQGKLHCPKCGTKVGSFSWVMGCVCPCGSLVAPAFYLTPSKIDWTNVVKNVEVTI